MKKRRGAGVQQCSRAGVQQRRSAGMQLRKDTMNLRPFMLLTILARG